ncbi:MAG: hypothetical protein HFH83_12740 [Lachnospiraceae bacterium]|jgi:hypothetical protein|nr:hypothetical protein [Lachnospiraceae bacterium]
MKRRSKVFASLLAAAALLLSAGNTLTVKAEEPVTYSVQYLGGEINQWRFLTGSTFDTTQAHMGADLLPTLLKDGDLVVVYNGEDKPQKTLDLGSAKLGNLTVYQGATAIVTTGGVKDCYILADTYCAVNGDVTNAYLYDNATCTFNDNVLDMTLYINDKPHSNITCGGTVGRFYVYSLSADKSTNVFYDIAAGAMKMENGTFQIPYDKYSPTPSEDYTNAMESASNPVPPAEDTPAETPAESTPAQTPADEYDHVPKTGDSTLYLWLFCASAACLTGGLLLRNQKHS